MEVIGQELESKYRDYDKRDLSIALNSFIIIQFYILAQTADHRQPYDGTIVSGYKNINYLNFYILLNIFIKLYPSQETKESQY